MLIIQKNVHTLIKFSSEFQFSFIIQANCIFKMSSAVSSKILNNACFRKRLQSSIAFQLSRFSTDNDNPFSKTFNIIKNDFIGMKEMVLGENNPKANIFPQHCDVLIVGGGIMGSSIAYWLKQRALDGVRLVVAEKDCTVNMNHNQVGS